MNRCGARHPEQDYLCTLPEGKHLDHEDSARHRWPNTEVIEQVERKGRTSRRGLAIARQVAQRATPRSSALSTLIVRQEPAEPREGTAQERVLTFLRLRRGYWVPTLDLIPVGGTEATRRIRELRDAGWPIESRQNPGRPEVWEYRLPRS